jgi:cholestenol delta-isomerase
MAAFWDLLSFVVAWMIIKDHPLRHPLQIVASLGQVYSVLMVCSTHIRVFEELVSGLGYEWPHDRVFWGLYFWLIDVWIVVPICKFSGAGDKERGCATDL